MDLDVHGGRKKAMTELRPRVVSGIKWLAVSQVGRQAAQLIITVILARLLSASDFGLLAMAMVVIGFINIFKDLGTSAAVIRQKDLSDSLLSSVFWVNVGFGAIAMLALFLMAPIAGLFYQEPEVISVLRVLSTTFFISGFGILHQSLLERSLSFDVLAKLEFASVVFGAIVGLILALLNKGVWSLVFQSLSSVSLVTVLLWLASSWRPRRKLDWREVKTVSRFGMNLAGFNIFNYFTRNADYLLIGRYLGSQELGYYTLAYRVLLFPVQAISAVIGRVLYPVLSSAQDDRVRFSNIYLKLVRSIAFVTFPLMLGLFAVANPFVRSFFGNVWLPVVPLIVIFTPVGLIQSIATTVGLIYQAMGKTDLLFRWGAASGFLTMIAFTIGVSWGIAGVAISYAIASIILAYPGFSIPFKIVDLRISQMLREVFLPLLNSGLMLAVLLLFRNIFFPISMAVEVELLIAGVIGAGFYGLSSWMTNRGQIRELWDLAGFTARKLHETE